MGNTALLFYYVGITLFAFFAVAPILLNTISLFGVQKRFAKEMIAEGVIDEESVKKLHPKKELAGVLISALCLFVLITTCYKTGSIGFVCGIISLTGGFLKFRNIIGFNSLTVQRFRNTYKALMDEKKYNKYVAEHF